MFLVDSSGQYLPLQRDLYWGRGLMGLSPAHIWHIIDRWPRSFTLCVFGTLSSPKAVFSQRTPSKEGSSYLEAAIGSPAKRKRAGSSQMNRVSISPAVCWPWDRSLGDSFHSQPHWASSRGSGTWFWMKQWALPESRSSSPSSSLLPSWSSSWGSSWCSQCGDWFSAPLWENGSFKYLLFWLWECEIDFWLTLLENSDLFVSL